MIAVSDKLAERINLVWGIKPKIIYNIIDTSIFNYVRKTSDENFVFLSVGNLVNRKGFDVLINSFARANFNDNVHLKIVGEGTSRDKLQQQIDSLGLSSRVQLMGRIERKGVAQIMKGCDAFVLASRAETFGVVYVEAMAAGLPVIATACGGPEDFVSEENGILIPADNEEKLTEALIEMYHMAHKYDKQAISEKTRKKFAPQTIAAQITDVYLDVLKSKK